MGQVTQSSKSKYFIKLCLFNQISQTSISILSATDSIKFLTEDTSFSRCSSTKNGGCIYYDGLKGQFSQNKICSYKAKAPKEGVYCFVYQSNKYKTLLFDSSVSCSGDNSNIGEDNILFRDDSNISNINISKARIFSRCIICDWGINNEFYLLYSTFWNNSMTRKDNTNQQSVSISNVNIYHSAVISYCNFLYNIGSTTNEFISFDRMNATVNYSSIIGNTQNERIFGLGNSHLTIDHSYIDTKIKSNEFDYIFNPVLDQSTALMSHISTFECQAVNIPILNNRKEFEKSYIELYFVRTFEIAQSVLQHGSSID